MAQRSRRCKCRAKGTNYYYFFHACHRLEGFILVRTCAVLTQANCLPRPPGWGLFQTFRGRQIQQAQEMSVVRNWHVKCNSQTAAGQLHSAVPCAFPNVHVMGETWHCSWWGRTHTHNPSATQSRLCAQCQHSRICYSLTQIQVRLSRCPQPTCQNLECRFGQQWQIIIVDTMDINGSPIVSHL